MNIKGTLSLTLREIRSAFLSPIALIFIGLFLTTQLFIFFTHSRFFFRGIADLRPLFEWMPLLLILLTSALSMRAWSEESRSGTLEVLLTLPIKTSALVLSKFLAALALVALALLCTSPLIWMVSELGMLDMGPVWGGYIASLVLASAYLAIGLSVSAFTEHQVIALLISASLCGVLYGLGSEAFMDLAGPELGAISMLLGTGARFESIERGVLDVRDLGYFASLTLAFLMINIIALERRRVEMGALRALKRSKRWRSLVLTSLLIIGNLGLGNLQLVNVMSGRIDLTEDQQFSASEVTRELLGALNEPVRITSYLSSTRDPQLNALIPQINDMLREYETLGQGRVEVESLDPRGDEILAEELKRKYKIEPSVMNVPGRTRLDSQAVYFHLLIHYGDTHKVLSAADFIELVPMSQGQFEAHLDNLEYQLSSAIKQLQCTFRSLDALLVSKPIRLTAYVSAPEHLAQELGSLSQLPLHLASVFSDLKRRATEGGGKLDTLIADPDQLPAAERDAIIANLKLEPFKSVQGQKYWLSAVIEVGERREIVDLKQIESTAEGVQTFIEVELRRCATQFRKTLGVITAAHTEEHPNLPYQLRRPDPKIDYRFLLRELESRFEVEQLKLEDSLIPSKIDLLLLARVGKLTPNQRFAIDQFLMRGGAVIAIANPYRAIFDQRSYRFRDEELPRDLVDLLAQYGVQVGPGYALDTQALDIIQSVPKSVGFKNIQIRYPYFVHSVRDQFKQPEHLALRGLNSLTLFWPAPVELTADLPEGVRGETLVTTSSSGWIDSTRDLTPWVKEPKGESARGERGLVVTLNGSIPSAFRGELKSTSTLYEEFKRTGRVLERAVTSAKLAVVGSSASVSDFLLFDPGLGPYYKRQYHLLADYESGLTLTRNLIEWASADDALVSIRKGSPTSRMLRQLNDDERAQWERRCYLFTFAMIGLMSAFAIISRSLRAARWARQLKEERT